YFFLGGEGIKYLKKKIFFGFFFFFFNVKTRSDLNRCFWWGFWLFGGGGFVLGAMVWVLCGLV
ncbi:hypothetical protein ACVGXN_05310, partial [Enterobacter hormaechei]